MVCTGFLFQNSKTFRPFSWTQLLLSYRHFEHSSFKIKCILYFLLSPIIWLPHFPLLNSLSTYYLLTIILKFPNCARPWLKCHFPHTFWSEPCKMHISYLFFETKTTGTLCTHCMDLAKAAGKRNRCPCQTAEQNYFVMSYKKIFVSNPTLWWGVLIYFFNANS